MCASIPLAYSGSSSSCPAEIYRSSKPNRSASGHQHWWPYSYCLTAMSMWLSIVDRVCNRRDIVSVILRLLNDEIKSMDTVMSITKRNRKPPAIYFRRFTDGGCTVMLQTLVPGFGPSCDEYFMYVPSCRKGNSRIYWI